MGSLPLLLNWQSFVVAVGTIDNDDCCWSKHFCEHLN